MKQLYSVQVLGESMSHFTGHYSEDEIEVIMKFLNDMDEHDVPYYDIPCITFTKDGKEISREDYWEEGNRIVV